MMEIGEIVELLFIGQALIATLTCLLRTDFNFAFALLSYYLWHNYKNVSDRREDIGKKLLALNAFLLVIDFIWIVTMSSVWGGVPQHFVAEWESYSGMRSFVLFLSVINLLVKVAAIGGLGMLFKDRLLPSGQGTQEDARGAYDMSPVVRGI
mmetsp:Transcript_17389/g.31383  ORF Transcript_17389/g.31383 Transcript_17389/m.31383 type:complete len:152 (+) Transcript_17389:1648-2103(+)